MGTESSRGARERRERAVYEQPVAGPTRTREEGTTRPIAVRALVDIVDALARLVHATVEVETHEPNRLLSLAEAARIAGTSVRILRDAIRKHEVSAYGRQRDRSVRGADLERWIESRRLRPMTGPVDADLEQRVARLARARSAADAA
jgi:hypothetical protein